MKKIIKLLIVLSILTLPLFLNGCGKKEEKNVEITSINYELKDKEGNSISSDKNLIFGEEYYITINYNYKKLFDGDGYTINPNIKIYGELNPEIIESNIAKLSITETEDCYEIGGTYNLPAEKYSEDSDDSMVITIKIVPQTDGEKQRTSCGFGISARSSGDDYSISGESADGKTLLFYAEMKSE